MRLHRFFLPFSSTDNSLIITDQEIVNQIKNVLRLKAGDEILIFNSEEERKGKIEEIAKNAIRIILKEEVINLREPKIKVKLFCSLLKKDNFELVVQKATEVGVKEIYPIISKRTVKFDFKKERMDKIIKEASEQSMRISLPILHQTISFQEALKESSQNQLNVFCDLSSPLFSEILKEKLISKKIDSLGVFIGPEGGWSEEEIHLAKDNNFLMVKLSDLVFRSETAAIIAVYLFSHLLANND
ncbi:MAG TPA: RsmE family RNA methyltransferase [Candidatus Paceibacterota bacterium]|nr:RsmE family RNA methyltransferase [Candidatus Paceibacterota bacterium]